MFCFSDGVDHERYDCAARGRLIHLCNSPSVVVAPGQTWKDRRDRDGWLLVTASHGCRYDSNTQREDDEWECREWKDFFRNGTRDGAATTTYLTTHILMLFYKFHAETSPDEERDLHMYLDRNNERRRSDNEAWRHEVMSRYETRRCRTCNGEGIVWSSGPGIYVAGRGKCTGGQGCVDCGGTQTGSYGRGYVLRNGYGQVKR